jgi:hypothetical protein
MPIYSRLVKRWWIVISTSVARWIDVACCQRLPCVEKSQRDIQANVQHNIEKEPSIPNIVSCHKPADAIPVRVSDEVAEGQDSCQQSHYTPEKPESIPHSELD